MKHVSSAANTTNTNTTLYSIEATILPLLAAEYNYKYLRFATSRLSRCSDGQLLYIDYKRQQ